MAQPALRCSLRNCGEQLVLMNKKRNRDRRPTYTCARGHCRKLCNECGKQVRAATSAACGRCRSVTYPGAWLVV